MCNNVLYLITYCMVNCGTSIYRDLNQWAIIAPSFTTYNKMIITIMKLYKNNENNDDDNSNNNTYIYIYIIVYKST